MVEKIDIGLPDKLGLAHHGSHIEITRKWFRWQIVVATSFAIFWDGLLFTWYSSIGENTDPMAIYFPLLHVAIGLGITYYALAGWVNQTRIIVGLGKLAVRHEPLPWLGNIELDTMNLKQLHTKEHITRGKNGPYVTYEVHATTHNSKNIKLVSGLDTSEQALYIEQEIEKYLGIKDIPVKGEIGGSIY